MERGVGGAEGRGALHVLLVKHLTGAACRKCLAGSAASLEKSLPVASSPLIKCRQPSDLNCKLPPILGPVTTLSKSFCRATKLSRGEWKRIRERGNRRRSFATFFEDLLTALVPASTGGSPLLCACLFIKF